MKMGRGVGGKLPRRHLSHQIKYLESYQIAEVSEVGHARKPDVMRGRIIADHKVKGSIGRLRVHFGNFPSRALMILFVVVLCTTEILFLAS